MSDPIFRRREGRVQVAIRVLAGTAIPPVPGCSVEPRVRPSFGAFWIIEDDAGTTVIDDAKFVAWFEKVGSGQFRPPEKVRAIRSQVEGRTRDDQRYGPGDWLLTDLSGEVSFVMRDEAFARGYEPDDGRRSTEWTQYRYRAFISYSRKDRRIAERLHRRLERYRLPRELARGGDRRLGRFFKDEDELAGSAGLGAAIDGAVDDSAALVVIASEHSARSTWVETEVRRFKKRRTAKVLALTVSGSPNSSEERSECFVPSLRFQVDGLGQLTDRPADPPLAPDLQQEGFAKAFIRLVAGLIDVPFDDLWARERRRSRFRRALSGVAAALSVCLVLAVIAAFVGRSDASVLRAYAARLASENWRFHSEAARFDPALRAAMASAALVPPEPGESWDLHVQSDAVSYALASSGRSAPFRRIHGERVDTTRRGNFRDDIPGADPAERLAIRAASHVCDMGWSSDGMRLAMTTSSGEVVVYEVESGTKVFGLAIRGVGMGSRVALDRAGRRALVSGGGKIRLLDLETSESRDLSIDGLLNVHEALHRDDGWLLAYTCSSGTFVTEWSDGGDLRRRTAVVGFTPYTSRASVAGRRRFMAFDSNSGLSTVDLEAEASSEVRCDGLADGVGQVKSLAVDPSGTLVALGGNGSGSRFGAPIQVISLPKAAAVQLLEGHTGEVYALVFLDTNVLVSGGSDFTVRLWDTSTGREVLRLAGHLGDVCSLARSPDGTMLASAAVDGQVILWDLRWLPSGYGHGLRLPEGHGTAPGWEFPSTVVEPSERQVALALQGRPWDVRDWRDAGSAVGIVQSIRAVMVRSLGWNWLDHAQPGG